MDKGSGLSDPCAPKYRSSVGPTIHASSSTDADASSAAKDPSDWVTGDEAMTGPQKSYLGTLAREAGEQLPDDLTKAEASEHIDRLQSGSDRTS